MNDLAGFLSSNDTYYGPGAVMSTFIGNHDVPRVIGFAEDQPLYGSDWDDGKARAWNNRPQLPNSSRPFERLGVAYTLLFTSPGVPLLYYGDEVGLPGGGDPDNRRFMPWSGLTADQTNLRTLLATLARIRKEHAALRRGTRTIRGATQHTLVYQMQTAGDDVFVALNRDDSAQPANGLPAGDYDDLVTGGMLRAPLSIPPRTGLVLKPR
jgi:glycosidase